MLGLISCQILFAPKQEAYIDFVEKLLKSFVEDKKIIYGERSLVYNVHQPYPYTK